jgi:hypothetical protein
MSPILTVSLSEEVDRKLRAIARKRYGGAKGSISKVLSELVLKDAHDREQEEINRRAIEGLLKGIDLGLKGRMLTRDEMHERGRSA